MKASAAERKIHAILEYADIPFEEEYTFPGLVAESGRALRFDFAIFDDNGDILCLIEYNGKQHYIQSNLYGGATGLSRQRHNDAAKRSYCQKNGIRLHTIPYTEEPNLSYDYLMRLIYDY